MGFRGRVPSVQPHHADIAVPRDLQVFDRQARMMRWCAANGKGRWNTSASFEEDGVTLRYSFERQEDAALFLVFWKG